MYADCYWVGGREGLEPPFNQNQKITSKYDEEEFKDWLIIKKYGFYLRRLF
tara:strand:+ start:55 stop:207 length:153 start_codon:yes stop_codon:yes gene_type:complete